MSTNSIGPGAQSGGNESHGNADGLGNKTLGENSQPAPEAGAESVVGTGLPSGVAGGQAKPDVKKNAQAAFPDGPNVEASPWELDAARGKLPDHQQKK